MRRTLGICLPERVHSSEDTTYRGSIYHVVSPP